MFMMLNSKLASQAFLPLLGNVLLFLVTFVYSVWLFPVLLDFPKVFDQTIPLTSSDSWPLNLDALDRAMQIGFTIIWFFVTAFCVKVFSQSLLLFETARNPFNQAALGGFRKSYWWYLFFSIVVLLGIVPVYNFLTVWFAFVAVFFLLLRDINNSFFFHSSYTSLFKRDRFLSKVLNVLKISLIIQYLAVLVFLISFFIYPDIVILVRIS